MADEKAARYPIGTFAQIAAIPLEARPRFLAELPSILATWDQIAESAGSIAAATRWPWWLAWLPQHMKATLLLKSIQRANGGIWVDDDKGTATVSVRMNEHSECLFAETHPLASPAHD